MGSLSFTVGMPPWQPFLFKNPSAARNTVDTLTIIRKLKERSLEVYFEKENNFLTKCVKKNCGEIPQYDIKDFNPAIIDLATFDLVQKETERRPERHKLHRSSLFAAKVIYGDCSGLRSESLAQQQQAS